MLGFYTIITFLQFFIRYTQHLSGPEAAQATGMISAIVIAAGAIVALVAGPLLDVFNRRMPNLSYMIIYSLEIVEVALGSAFIWKIKGTR